MTVSNGGFNKHWPEMKFSKNMLQDALIKHVLGLTNYHMADIGEVFEVTVNLKHGNEENWINSWSTMADRLQKKAQDYETKDKKISAASAYLRASTYWRVSLMYFSKTEDVRMKDYCLASQNCYDKALKLSDYPGTAIQIPYEDTTLPGHYFTAPSAGQDAPLLIVVPGRDTWADDTRWVTDAAIKRGINALTFDGPGQGMSFGGFQIPRAAAFDKRIKICITDPGNIAWGKVISQRLKKILSLPRSLRPALLEYLLKDYTWKQGCSEENLLNELAKYDNTQIINKISAKTLVLNGAAEVNPTAAKEFYDLLTCPKDYLFFDENSTAQQHTQMGGYAPASEEIFNWISDNL